MPGNLSCSKLCISRWVSTGEMGLHRWRTGVVFSLRRPIDLCMYNMCINLRYFGWFRSQDIWAVRNHVYFDGLVRGRCDSIADALELCFPCADPSIYACITCISFYVTLGISTLRHLSCSKPCIFRWVSVGEIWLHRYRAGVMSSMRWLIDLCMYIMSIFSWDFGSHVCINEPRHIRPR